MSSEPFPHQIDGAAFALANKASLLAHDVGTGKSRTGVMVADQSGARRILVCCPSLAVGVWRDQFAQWSKVARTVHLRHSPANGHAGVTVVPYEMMSTQPDLVARMMQQHWDLAIFDEAHWLKTFDSARTVAAYGPNTNAGLASRADKVVLLTGSPMLNHVEEMWTHFRALRSELLAAPGRDSFIATYCEVKYESIGGRMIERIVGAKKGAPLEDLRKRLKLLMHRVRKRDVFPDMPPALWTVVPIAIADLKLGESVLREWREAERGLWRDIGSATGDDLLAAAKASPHSATQRRLTGVIKTQAAAAAITDELDCGVNKVVVFAQHTLVINELCQALAPFRPIVIDGRTPQGVRESLIELFKTEIDRRVFIGQIDTCSEVIDLTVASNVWIVEQAWTPKVNIQAVGRCDRFGQKETVNARFLALEGSIDLAIARINARKARDIDNVIDTLATADVL